MSELSIHIQPPTNYVERVAANVRAEAGRAGWKQADLARALGVGRATVNKRWRGARQWQLEDLDVIARALGVSVSYLVRDDEEAPRQDDGGPLVRHQGLEPQTRWLGENASHQHELALVLPFRAAAS